MPTVQLPCKAWTRIDLDTYFKLLLEFNKCPGSECATSDLCKCEAVRCSQSRLGIHFTNVNVGAKIGF